MKKSLKTLSKKTKLAKTSKIKNQKKIKKDKKTSRNLKDTKKGTTLHIYIFRHGQSYYNKHHIFTGWKDSKLTPRGIRDARQVARKLKDKRIDIVFCSHLSRSKDTLKEVLRYHPKCKKVIVDDRIIERSYGDLAGKSKDKYARTYGEEALHKVRRSYLTIPPNGENIKMVEKRVNSFIHDLIKLMKKEKVNVAISAHGNSMRPLRKYFEKLTIKEMMKLENPWDDYFEYKIKV